MVSRRALAATVAAVLTGPSAVAGCGGLGSQAAPSVPPVQPVSPLVSPPVSPYVQPSLPRDCQSVFALVDRQKAGGLALRANASPEGADRDSLYCDAWGESAAGKMTFNLRLHMYVQVPGPGRDTPGEVQQWARDSADGFVAGSCDRRPEVVTAESRYTVRCARSSGGPLVVSLAVVGERLQVAGADMDISVSAPVSRAQALARAEVMLRAVVEAGLSAR